MKKIRRRKGKRTISRTMFIAFFIAINIMPLFGYVFMSVIGPKVYSNQVIADVESSIIECIDFYGVDLDGVADNPEMEIYIIDDVSSSGYHIFTPRFKFEQLQNLIDGYLLDEVEFIEESYGPALQVDHLLDAIAMSKSAVIELSDADGNLIYETPEWYVEALKNPGRKSSGSDFRERFLPKNSLMDEHWITDTKYWDIDDGYYLTIKLNVSEFMRNLAMITRLYYYIMIFGLLLALAFSIILTRILTKPLKELQDLAKRMEDLDFSAQYEGEREDEIGNLGRSLNHMMDRLSITIDRLKGELDKEKRTDKLRKRFIAQVSHELKTPVAVVSNYVEALQDDIADTKEERDSYLAVIEKECGKMVHIINDLLDISQLESGNFKVFKDRVDLHEVLVDIGDRFAEILRQDIKFDVKIADKQMIVDADMIRIEQAINNLLTNAEKHTAGDKEIRLTAVNENEMVHIKVFNEGDSISDENILHIWEPFTKGENEKGAGLGLSITKSIVELHGGEYYVRNVDGGVLFGIRLPLID